MEASIRTVEELEAILDNVPDHIFLFSESGYCRRIYDSKEDPFAISPSHYIDKHLTELYDAELATCFQHCIDTALNQSETLFVSYVFEMREIIIFPDYLRTSEKLWFEGRLKELPLGDSEERIVMWSARNITQRRLLEEKIEKLAKTDELTNLYNRRALLKQLSDDFVQYKRYGNQYDVGFLIIDIDDFKDYNDNFGHLTGDKVIKHITELCSAELRSSDYFGRLGGEEFAVILPHTDMLQALNLAERLRKAVEDFPYHINGHCFKITISIGVSQFKLSDTGISDVLSRADKAMYTSKRLGKNRVTELNAFALFG